MSVRKAALVGLSTIIALASAGCQAETNITCPAVHMFLARGTTESYPGLLGSLTDLVLDSVNGSTYENIIYPATQEGSTPSYEEGIANGTAQLTKFVHSCPKSKVVLLAYSQGAMVVSDMLAGGGDNGTLGNYTRPSVDAHTIGSHITAVVLYGDPRHMPNQTYNTGDVAATGKYPRTSAQLMALSQYAQRMQDYCDYKDGVCDASGTNLTAHTAYATYWDTTAASWLKGILE